jgi:proteasome-associated ATPase
MSDRRPIEPQDQEPNGKTEDAANPSMRMGSDPLELIEQCLASFPDSDPRQKILYKLRHAVILRQAAHQQREVEFKKVADVIAKLTAPANRVGTLLEVPGEGLARILVGGAEYYAAVDPRVQAVELKIGAQILVNEAYAVIKILGYDRNGPVLKVAEALADGRLRFEQEMGRQVLILQRSSDLVGVDLKAGDEVRIEPSLHVAIEKLEDRKAKSHLLDEVPTVTWEQIGGQTEAIAAIQKAIEYPLLHTDTFQRFKFTQPKRQSLKAGGGVRPGRARYGHEGGQAAGDSRGLSPRQGARDFEYVVGGIGTDGPGSLRPGPRSSERWGVALYIH